MDLGTALSVVQTLFAALQCQELKEICSLWGYKSQLNDLQSTVETVKAVLLDAEAKQENLTNQQQLWIQELKDAVYDADDLLDEFVTVAERKHKKLLHEGDHGKVAEKVRLLFSRLKDISFARKMSNGVKEVRRKLDNIASNHNQFGFKLDSQPIRKRREETCSYVSEQDIIMGRKEDTENIVGWLLDGEDDQRDVSFLTIVGIGGLGKTTLAQLVYNDKRVANHFDLKLWACVSDQDTKHLDAQGVLAKLLGSKKSLGGVGSTMEELQGQVRKLLAEKKYLLILDDVWNENRDEWLNLVKFFRGNHSGSWVVVTTRSKMTAQVVDGLTCDLQGLSDEDSWDLFTKIAFGQEEDATNMADLKEIGQKIVKKCANVPLAIRVVGSLLYGQGKNKWMDFQKKCLAEIKPNNNGIWPILKLSYYNLESPLKSCFGYCALFPKDFKKTKEELVNLWMAQGYIIPLYKGQEIEDAAQEYFSTLLRRCFLQICEYNKSTYTMHDLMHDLAQEVVGDEVCAVTSTSKLDDNTRHIWVVDSLSEASSLTKIRSLFLSGDKLLEDVHLDKLLVNWMCLRTLQLRYTKAKSLPDTIGKLIHLRYLDLSWNSELEALPHSITKLYNLQTLLLYDCSKLKELPDNLSKLMKLRMLDIRWCYELTHMPLGMGKLSHLCILTDFLVGEASSSSRHRVIDQLQDLKALVNLKDTLKLKIKIPRNDVAYVKKKGTSGGGYLSNKQHLKGLNLILEREEEEGDKRGEYEEALIEDLQPPPNLRWLWLEGYEGMRMPRWMEGGNFEASFSNLVEIRFRTCDGLQYLPSLGKLSKLKWLKLSGLRNLEYMEMNTSSSEGMTRTRATPTVVANPPFFPSLEELELSDLPQLKGWWKPPQVEMGDDEESTTSRQPSLLPSFQRLSKLEIEDCPELTVIPLCPSLEELKLEDYNEGLRIIMNQKEEGPSSTFSSSSSAPSSTAYLSWDSESRSLTTSNVKGLKLILSPEALQCLKTIEIENDQEMESLGEAGELFQSCSSSLQTLEIRYCSKLRSVCGGLQHLTALESLEIHECPNLSLEEEKEAEEKGLPWSSLGHSLRSLALIELPKVVKLPKAMQYLTSLHSLHIGWCESLESMPEWMPKLTSLTRLEIEYCSERLHQRCKESPAGEDWPYIRHIPHVKNEEPVLDG